MKRRTFLKGGALVGLAPIGSPNIPPPHRPCVRIVVECSPIRMPPIDGLTHLSDYVAQQETAPGRKVVHTHEAANDLSYAVVEIACGTRQQAQLLAQRISATTPDNEYGPICEVAYYEGL